MRLQIEVTEDQDRHIQSLMEQTGLATKKDLFNNALTLLSWAIEEVANGNTIASVNEEENRYRVLQMPILTHVARHMKAKFGDVRRKARATAA
jgi:hypothetical protein